MALRSRFVGLLFLAVGLLLPSAARAEHILVHGELGLARDFGGHQERELSFGAAGFGALEIPFLPQLGGEVELGTVLLANGDPPRDPNVVPEGGAHAIYGAVGGHLRPFVKKDPSEITKLTGIWLSGNVGAVTTGGRFRAVVDASLGYDFLIQQGKYGVGPALSWVHVFQPDDDFRPEDANIYVLGVHVMFDNGSRVPSDRDHDGIIDRLDACPDVPEDKDDFQDEDGCPDLDHDGDGILDARDHCPNDAEDRDGFEDQDGCPDPDNDKDQIPDVRDKCPNDPEDYDGFQDEDGCPDTDNDQDGIVDKEDLCPNEPETKNGYADDDGCPDEDQVRVVGEKIILDDRIHFEENNAIIRSISFPLLERLTRLVLDNPTYVHIEVQGHADQRGPEDYNKKLSEDRAKSVVDFMVKHGVDGSRLSAVGFGASHVLVDERSERALFLNRRVEFQITRDAHPFAAPGSGPAPAGATPGAGQNDMVPNSAPTSPTAPASAPQPREPSSPSDAAPATPNGEPSK